jgi:acyl dehydratase
MANKNPLLDLQVGDVVATRDFSLTRDSLVRYAGASGDLNPIHYRDDIAQSVGLDGVLAHGMLTMGLAIQPVASWLGGFESGQIVSYSVRFTKPVYVPSQGSVGISVSASVSKLSEPEPNQLTLMLQVATDAGVTVLGKALVVVSFS